MRLGHLLIAALPLAAQAPKPGSLAFFQQDPKRIALGCAEKAVSIDPDDRDLLISAAEIKLSLGDRAGAETLLERVTIWAQANRRDGVLQRVGETWMKWGLLKEARRCFELMPALDSLDRDGSRMLARLGGVHLERGDRPGAEAAFATAAEFGRARKDGTTFQLIGLAWLKANAIPEALMAYEGMEKADPTDEDNFRDAGLDLLGANRLAEAEAMFKKAFSLKSTSESMCREIGLAYLDKGVGAEAGTWLDRAATANPREYSRDWEKCLEIGRLAHKRNLPALAAKWFEKAVAARPGEEKVWFAIATLLTEPASASASASGQH